jgi:hypothetical protein
MKKQFKIISVNIIFILCNVFITSVQCISNIILPPNFFEEIQKNSSSEYVLVVDEENQNRNRIMTLKEFYALVENEEISCAQLYLVAHVGDFKKIKKDVTWRNDLSYLLKHGWLTFKYGYLFIINRIWPTTKNIEA